MKNLETPLSKSTVDSILKFVSFENDKFHSIEFDGDIIRSYHYRDEKGIVHWNYDRVLWNDAKGQWWITSHPTDDTCSEAISMPLYEFLANPSDKYPDHLIGNIHENLDMLEV